MITLLHGDNINASRREIDLHKLRAKDKEIIHLFGNTVSESELTQALESDSLFGNDKFIIIENLLSSKKKLNFEKILNENQDKDLLLWENKEVSKTVINKLPKSVNIKLFKIPTVIFKFLDSLFPGNERSSLLLLRECLNYSDPEMVFFMIIRQIRNLIIVKDLGNNSSSITSWQSSRLTNQAKSFTIDKLIAMYKKLLEMDISIKTGTSSYSLQKQIELFILSLKDV